MKMITPIPILHIFEILPLAYVSPYQHFAYRGEFPGLRPVEGGHMSIRCSHSPRRDI